MKALTKIAAGGVVAAALFAAAPAAAQYYPSPYGYNNYGGNVVGQVLNQVLGGGYSGYNGYNGYGSYGANSQAAVGQCVNAVQARLGGNYGYGAYNGYAGGRVLGISRVEGRSNGGLTIRGVANSGRQMGYGYNTNAVDLTFKCKTDYRGFITDVDVDRATSAYGNYGNYGTYNNYGYNPNDPYAAYGYRRY
jgi:hypothetical protein